MAKRNKPRITLADLESVEIKKAELPIAEPDPAPAVAASDDGSAYGDAGPESGPAATSATEPTDSGSADSGSVGSRSANSGSASSAASVSRGPSTAQLSSLPEGVSPEVAKLLAMPEPEPEPAPVQAPTVTAAAVPLPPPPAKRSRLPLALAVVAVLAGGTVAAWFATQAPPLDVTPHAALLADPPPPPSAVAEIGFQAIPEPIVPEPVVEEPAAENRSSSSSSRRRRGSTRVRGEDLF